MEGDLIDGWKVDKISGEGLTLVSGGRSVHMSVFSNHKPGRKSSKPVAMLTKQSVPAPAPKTSHNKVTPARNAKNVPKPAGGVKSHPGKPVDNPFTRLLQRNRNNLKIATPGSEKGTISSGSGNVPAAPGFPH